MLVGILTAALAYSRVPADDIPRRHYLYSGITLGIPLNLIATNPLYVLYWFIPCLADGARRYRDYDLHFLRFFANTAYIAVLIQTGWQLWRPRPPAPPPPPPAPPPPPPRGGGANGITRTAASRPPSRCPG